MSSTDVAVLCAHRGPGVLSKPEQLPWLSVQRGRRCRLPRFSDHCTEFLKIKLKGQEVTPCPATDLNWSEISSRTSDKAMAATLCFVG